MEHVKFGSFFLSFFYTLLLEAVLKRSAKCFLFSNAQGVLPNRSVSPDCFVRSVNAIPPRLQPEVRKNSFPQSPASAMGWVQQVGSTIVVHPDPVAFASPIFLKGCKGTGCQRVFPGSGKPGATMALGKFRFSSVSSGVSELSR